MSRMLVPTAVTVGLFGGVAAADVPQVAVDIAPVHSLVARVMQGLGTPDLVIQPGGSPHEYSLRPSEAAALQNADLVFWVGEDLTPWLEDAVGTLAADAVVTTLLEAEGITLLDFREGALFEAHDHRDDDHGHDDDDHDHDHDHAEEEHAGDHDHEHSEDDHAHDDHGDDDHDHDHDKEEHSDHDHEHGDEDHAHDDDDHDHDHAHDDHGHSHGEHDPHAWLSPENARIWLNVIAAQLSAADPDNAGTYFANAAAGREELAALITELEGTLAPASDLRFVVFHDAYQYFETSFGISAAGAISIGDATDPSPARIAEIQARIADEGIDCVFAEPQFSQGLVATVLDGTEAATAVIDPLGVGLDVGPDLYPRLLRGMATAIAGCR